MKENYLMKDPYLRSAQKMSRPDSAKRIAAYQGNRTQYQNINSFNDQPSANYEKWRQENQNLKSKLNFYQKDIHTLRNAINERQVVSHKLLNLQATNAQFTEAMKIRNLDLNNKVNDLALQRQLLEQHYIDEKFKNNHDRDTLINRYQQQTQEILSLKRMITMLTQQKQHAESEISHLAFVLENQTTKLTLELKQQGIRMENLQRTYKNIVNTKDQEIKSLGHRLKIYEDQNRRLNQINRTLQISKNDRINNLSRIPDMESHAKSFHRSVQKQNNNPNIHIVDELENEKQKNNRMAMEIQGLKKQKLNFQNAINRSISKQNNASQQREVQRERVRSTGKFEIAKSEGLIGSIVTLRNGINKEVFEVFFKSIRQGEKRRQNSLVIFITNWKNIDLQRIQPYVESYLQARDNLKQLLMDSSSKGHPLKVQMEQCIPIHVASRKGRSKINEWILSTVQFTKNQKQSGKQNINNLLLFLFRLLTIQYRITYPMQGKSFSIDSDVRNELLHETCKAIKLLIQFK